jgi:hypothetical protein
MLGHHHVRRQPLRLDSASHFLLDHQSPSSFLVAEKRARTLHSGQVFRGNFVQNQRHAISRQLRGEKRTVTVDFVLAKQMTCALTRGHGLSRMNRLQSGRRRRRFERPICSVIAILLVAAAVSALMLRLVRLAPAFGWSRGRVRVHFFFEDKKKSSLSRAFFSEKDETFSRVKCSRIKNNK